MVLLVRAILSSRATSPCLASTTALAVESLTSCAQLSTHCGNELLEVILKRKNRVRGRLAMDMGIYKDTGMHSNDDVIRDHGQPEDTESSKILPSNRWVVDSWTEKNETLLKG